MVKSEMKNELKNLKKKYKKIVIKRLGCWCIFIVIGVLLISLAGYHIIPIVPELWMVLGGTTIAFSGLSIYLCLKSDREQLRIEKYRSIAEHNECLHSIAIRDWQNAARQLANKKMSAKEEEMALTMLEAIETNSEQDSLNAEFVVKFAIDDIVVEYPAINGVERISVREERIPLPSLGLVTSSDRRNASILHAFSLKCKNLESITIQEFELFEDNRLRKMLDSLQILPKDVNGIICQYTFPFPDPITEENTTSILEAYRNNVNSKRPLGIGV